MKLAVVLQGAFAFSLDKTRIKQFKQIAQQYSDGQNGRCALGVIMSYYGWNGKDDSQVTRKLLSTLIALNYADIDKNLLAELNDSGMPFDEIADHLDKFGGSRKYR